MNKQWKTTESRRCIRNIFSTGDLFIYILYMFEIIQSTHKKKNQRTNVSRSILSAIFRWFRHCDSQGNETNVMEYAGNRETSTERGIQKKEQHVQCTINYNTIAVFCKICNLLW